jgi:hypothetical protein
VLAPRPVRKRTFLVCTDGQFAKRPYKEKGSAEERVASGGLCYVARG